MYNEQLRRVPKDAAEPILSCEQNGCGKIISDHPFCRNLQ